jgi:hypothetical protein
MFYHQIVHAGTACPLPRMKTARNGICVGIRGNLENRGEFREEALSHGGERGHLSGFSDSRIIRSLKGHDPLARRRVFRGKWTRTHDLSQTTCSVSLTRPLLSALCVVVLLHGHNLGPITGQTQIGTFGVHEVKPGQVLVDQGGAKQRTATARAGPPSAPPRKRA